MYAISILTRIRRLESDDVQQVWYADDATAIGKLDVLREWSDKLEVFGPSFVYYQNPSKTWLITKEVHINLAIDTFKNTDIKVTKEGRYYLGSPLGSKEFVMKAVEEKVKEWCLEVENLLAMAVTQLHEAYSAFTHGLFGKWIHLLQTCADIELLLVPLEESLRMKFILSLMVDHPQMTVSKIYGFYHLYWED